jgi:hypothetical protein
MHEPPAGQIAVSRSSKTSLLGQNDSAAVARAIRALGFRHPATNQPVFSIHDRMQVFGGREIRVICATDGTGEIIAENNSAFVAVNGAARGWAKSKLWVVEGKQLVQVFDSGFPNNVPKRFQFLEQYIDAIIATGAELCPLPSPAGESAFHALQVAIGAYSSNAQRLGTAIP